MDTGHVALLARAFGSFPSFCGLLQIVPKTGGRQRLVLNEIQRAYCKTRTQRDVVLKARQVGFTTLEQARDVWCFLTKPGARVVATCQSMTDGTPKKLLAATYRIFFESLRRLGVQLNFRSESAGEWVLADRDSTLRIIEAGASEAAASKKGRAGTITRLHLTETAFYEFADETLNALLECVPGANTGSEIVSESTPNGAGGTFYEQWQAAVEGRSGYTPHFFPWHMQGEYQTALAPGEALVADPGLTPEQTKWYRQKVAQKGADLAAQEYPNDPSTCFLVSGTPFFSGPIVAAGLKSAIDPNERLEIRRDGARGTLSVWHPAERRTEYVLALDCAEGTGGDASAGIVFERGTGRHMATLWGQFKPVELARAAVGVAHRYNHATIAPERNNHGHACLAALQIEHHYPRIFYDRDEKPGWLTTEVSRTPALDNLEEAHRNGHFVTHDKALLGEMRTFTINPKTGKAEAAPGSHDDLVMATAIGWNVICRAAARRDLTNLPPR